MQTAHSVERKERGRKKIIIKLKEKTKEAIVNMIDKRVVSISKMAVKASRLCQKIVEDS